MYIHVYIYMYIYIYTRTWRMVHEHDHPPAVKRVGAHLPEEPRHVPVEYLPFHRAITIFNSIYGNLVQTFPAMKVTARCFSYY